MLCCGEKMRELIPNTVEASGEKHLPVVERSGSTLTVTVGAVEHPMVDVHHIQWLYVETVQGGHIRYLHPGEAPRAVFELGDETPVAVYAYCNLHGLWTTKLCYNKIVPSAQIPGKRDPGLHGGDDFVIAELLWSVRFQQGTLQAGRNAAGTHPVPSAMRSRSQQKVPAEQGSACRESRSVCKRLPVP